MRNTVRSSISIPTGLKRRMDALGDRVNWSDVACRAIERRLAEESRRKPVGTEENAVYFDISGFSVR